MARENPKKGDDVRGNEQEESVTKGGPGCFRVAPRVNREMNQRNHHPREGFVVFESENSVRKLYLTLRPAPSFLYSPPLRMHVDGPR